MRELITEAVIPRIDPEIAPAKRSLGKRWRVYHLEKAVSEARAVTVTSNGESPPLARRNETPKKQQRCVLKGMVLFCH
jgi:hypothetical protein